MNWPPGRTSRDSGSLSVVAACVEREAVMRRRFTLILVLAFAVGLLVPGAASAAEDWVIADSGAVTLTGDHTGSILILADGVSLDCDGYGVLGGSPTPLQHGVRIDANDVTVRNCHIGGFGYSGVFTHDTVGLILEGNTVHHNGSNGFGLYRAIGIAAVDNDAYGNGESGFKIRSTIDSTFTGNEAWLNGFAGFFVLGDEAIGPSSGNLFEGNTARQNDVGVSVLGSSGNTFHGNEVHHNTEGFSIWQSSDNTVEVNSIQHNVSIGIALGEGIANQIVGNAVHHNETGINVWRADHNLFRGNISSQNSGSGISIGASHNNLIEGNVASRNVSEDFAVGIGLWVGSSGNIIEGNVANQNSHEGIHVGVSSNSRVVDNSTMGNGRYGFYFGETSLNEVTGNRAVNNREAGFALWMSSDNTLADNEAVNNGDRKEGWGIGFKLSENSDGNVLTENRGRNNVECDAADWGTDNTWQDNDLNRWCTE